MTPSSSVVVPPVSRRRPFALARGWVSLPDRILVGFLAVSVVIVLALITEQFRWWLVLPAALIALVLTRRWIPRTPVPQRAAVLGTLLALAIVVGWCVLNVPLSSEIMGIDRDPGQYTLSGLYLIDHPSADIRVDEATQQLARSIPGVVVDWTGKAPAPRIHVQGTSLVPGLIGMFGWIFGPAGALHALVVVAGIGLLALYAVSRRFLGPLWGLLPPLALALSMPLAAFGRMPYTEPSSLIFGCGAMLCLWTGIERGNSRLFLLAGLFAGASVMARVDGFLALIGGIVGIGALGMFSVGAVRRARLRRWLGSFLLGGAVTVAIGVTDLALHSPSYLMDTVSQLVPLVAVLVAVAVIAWLVTIRARPSALALAVGRHRGRWAVGAQVFVGVVLLVLVSRPLWLVSHLMWGGYASAVANRQRSEGLPIDGPRSYDEYTVNWLAWYFGWAVVAVAAVGVLLLVRRMILRRDARTVVLLAIPATTALLYLNKVTITPDQIWAMRRLVPGVVPGALLVAGYACREAARWLGARIRAAGGQQRHVRWGRALVAAASVVVFAAPVLTWGELFTVREGAGEQALVADICSYAPGDRVVHAGENPSFGHFVPALQQACGLQAVGVGKATTERMSAVAQQWGDPQSILVVAFDANAVTWQGGRPGTPLSTNYQRWEELLMRRPQVANERSATAWLGLLRADGTVAPINAG
ncbi:ArnT family glycosyltransferase [Nakamurella lactea]|uniref:ArnT family glycosyltransferase n=1 Tax=Nakamurella lactea TaxID=459515 RepID=UPI00041A8B78|nr:hypothetical protein [Nakamurella lactea]